ncbi:SpoIID/LytB domain-containing protein [bacterium]|nr:SpoIID/LytB domain-containing protein [bacterium]
MRKIDRGKAKIFFLFLGILCIFSLLIFANGVLAAEKQPILRVGIFLNQTEINISGDGSFKICNLKSNNLISEEHNKIVKLLPHDKGIEILGKGVYSGPIKIIPVGNTKIIVIINGQKYRYRGNIEINIDKEYRKLNIINIIGIEEYLYGVMKKEISPLWLKEALKAQAVAARTFAIFNINKHIDQGYNLCATTHCQAYGGVNHEDHLTNKAVDETRGVFITYKGKPINAVYHSDSGGYTEDSENVWGSFEPYLRSVESKFEEKVSPPHHTWSYSINEKDLTEKLQKQGYEINSVVSIEPNKKSETGRIGELVFTADNNKVINMKTNDFRSLIGADLIRSTLFNIEAIGKELNITEDIEDKKEIENKEEQKESIKEILEQKEDWTIQELLELMKKNKQEQEKKKEKDKIVPKVIIMESYTPFNFLFSGSGNGHGVGMSQWGAYGMALQGYKYQDILKYYYQGIDIIKKY